MMIKKVMVPLDGSPQAASALPLATAFANATGAGLHLVRVVHGPADRHDTREAFDAADRYLSRVQAELAGNGLHATCAVAGPGLAAEVLAGAAREQHADLVLMATRGRSGVTRALAGSVAQGLLHLTDVPLALVKPGGKRVRTLRTLLVPVDGTPGGALALASASGLARQAGARLLLQQVVPPFPYWLYGASGGVTPVAAIDPAWQIDSLRSAEDYVQSLAARLRAAGLDAEWRVSAGQVSPSIGGIAHEVDADLIVMSTHALTGPTRALLGSTADEVVRTAQHPVLLVRRPDGIMDRLAMRVDSPADVPIPTPVA